MDDHLEINDENCGLFRQMNILTIKRTKNEYILMNLINGMLRITSNMFNLMIGFEEIHSEDLTETWLRRDLLMSS